MRLNNNKKYHSWEDIQENSHIFYIEDPILSIEVTKDIFFESYEEILKTFTHELINEDNLLDLSKSMDYYFEKNPLRPNTLIFKDGF